jgi:hypothetical protein
MKKREWLLWKKEEEGCLFIQPATDEFIDALKGVLAGRGLPSRVERDPDRDPSEDARPLCQSRRT